MRQIEIAPARQHGKTMKQMAAAELKRAAQEYGEHYRPGGVPRLESIGNTKQDRAARQAARQAEVRADRVARVMAALRAGGSLTQMALRISCSMSNEGVAEALAQALATGKIARAKPGRYFKYVLAAA
jgi:hypothetical protein